MPSPQGPNVASWNIIRSGIITVLTNRIPGYIEIKPSRKKHYLGGHTDAFQW
jgi:hypothetical protein